MKMYIPKTLHRADSICATEGCGKPVSSYRDANRKRYRSLCIDCHNAKHREQQRQSMQAKKINDKTMQNANNNQSYVELMRAVYYGR